MRIGDVARMLGMSADTLRYYEKIGLMPRAAKRGGARYYSAQELSRVRFIRRAQTLKFSLEEIKLLVGLREKPAQAQPRVRALAASKLETITHALADMGLLQKELKLLLHLCNRSDCGCPIIAGIEDGAEIERPAASRALKRRR